MILKGKERGGGRQLGLYLLRTDSNEHVEVHELRGFVSDDLPSAFQEIDAIGRSTKATNLFFSLSLNPPPNARVTADQYASAVDAVERKLGLHGQPRAIVFHEKDGRRHAHAVWSRIDTETMTAINLSFYGTKLRDVARDQFLEHGWHMPPGYVNSKERSPHNYNLTEWQQAKRGEHDPKALKQMFRELWISSDSGKAFAAALQSRGYTHARGDSRGHVAVDYRGEVYSIARYTGVRTKDVRARLGDPDEKIDGKHVLLSVEDARDAHAGRMTDMLKRHVREAEERRRVQALSLLMHRKQLVERQRKERAQLQHAHETRQATETRERTQRFSRGLRGFWHRITGKHAEIKRRNEGETLAAQERDGAERERLTFRHVEERRPLHQQIKQLRQRHAEQVAELHRDIAGFEHACDAGSSRANNIRDREGHERSRSRRRTRDRGRDFER